MESSLTDRQRTVIRGALDRGYYEWPREIKSGELADALDISRATLQEHLRKAERTLLSAGLDGDGLVYDRRSSPVERPR